LPEEIPSAVNAELLSTIKELQAFKSLDEFVLAGGTSLAIRFNHRYSYDIDLFTNRIIGLEGFKKIEEELIQFYRGALIAREIINEESGDQFCFLRAFISMKSGNAIKIEILQNMAFMYPVEILDTIRILSIQDIALFKLMSASNRKARKDVYDLDIITERIALSELLENLQAKHEKYCREEHKCLFDLDKEVSPNANLDLLLEFDNHDYLKQDSRPNHSTDAIDTVPGSKDWQSAKSSWRRKVRNLMREKGLPIPPVRPIN